MRRSRVGTVEFKCKITEERDRFYFVAKVTHEVIDPSYICGVYRPTKYLAWADCEAFMASMGAVRIEE